MPDEIADAATAAPTPPAVPTVVSAALGGLDAWKQSRVDNTAISQNTAVLNRIISALRDIRDALGSVKE